MSLTLIISFFCLILIAFLGRFVIKLPKNVWLLFLAQPLGMLSASMLIFTGGLIASKIAPRPDLATLPITSMILATAIAVIPASLLMKKLGRRKGIILGLSTAVIGALLIMCATLYSWFSLLIAGAIFLGSSMAFVAQMRFVALESLSDSHDAPKAISVLMVGGIFAAILGPELAVDGKFWIESTHGFAGSFLGLAILLIIAILVIAKLDPIVVKESPELNASRSLKMIISQPIFIIAISAGAIGYAVMSYVMTAAPLSMHEIEGHSLHSTKWVIQSHIVAMYLPSLFSAFFIRYLGLAKLMILGSLIYAAVIWVALLGKQEMHYWWTMVLLGVGWNFLYTSGTLLLHQIYRPEERFKIQAINDFLIFIVQALASLSAGFIIFNQGWSLLVSIAIPMVLIIFCISIWYFLLVKNEDKTQVD